MRRLMLLLALLLPAVALATAPVFESSDNRDGYSFFAKRKGYTGAQARGDTLYIPSEMDEITGFLTHRADTTIVYYLWPTTTMQVQAIASGNDSCRFAVDILIGRPEATNFGSMVVAYSYVINTAGYSMPINIPFSSNAFLIALRALPGNGAVTKARIILSRSKSAVSGGPSEAFSDTTTRNSPGAFPGIATRGFTTAALTAKVKKLATSVTLRPEGFIRLLNLWAPLDAENDTLTYADSTSAFFRTYEIPATIDSLRWYWTTEAGGTDAAVTSLIKLVR